jgi:hypothetical protein
MPRHDRHTPRLSKAANRRRALRLARIEKKNRRKTR